MSQDVLAQEMAVRGGVLTEALQGTARMIEAGLDGLLPPVSGGEGRVVDAMRYAVLGGGKRMRGFLVMEVASMFGVRGPGPARVAASVEMLHAYSLVHDDLPAMDDDDLRRGKPSTHRAFDEATAILAGDALQTRAFEILAEPQTHRDAQVRCELVLALGRAAGAAGMVGGQMIDMVSEGLAGEAPSLGLAELLRLQALKTGRLIQYSAEAGAILGCCDPEARAHIAAYGRELGAAFQIADDILDETGTTGQIGKTAGKDAATGKATVVGLLGLARAQAQARALADSAAAQLDWFGAGSERLRELAAFVVARTS